MNQREQRRRAQRREVHNIKESGSVYQGAYGNGDVILKNRPLPYSFIQLNPKAMNKRFKKRAQKELTSFMVQEKKSGGLSGMRQKVMRK